MMTVRMPKAWLIASLLFLFLALAIPSQARAQSGIPKLIQQLFPEATEIGPQQQNPPVWPVYQVTELIGYAFLSGDYAQIPGFSGAPYQLLIGIDKDGHYRDVRVLEHHEPIFLHGLGPGPMHAFTRQYRDLDLRQTIKITSATVRDKHSGANVYIDGVTKATVSAVVLNETVMLSALKAAQATGLIPYRRPPAAVRMDLYESLNWQQLRERGWIKRLHVSATELEQAFADSSVPGAGDEPVDSKDTVADLHYLYLNPPSIGRYLLGEAQYQRLLERELEPGEHAIAVLSHGPYSPLGENFVRGTPPDRLALHQGELQIELRDTDFFNMVSPSLPADAPTFSEFNIFRIKAGASFDPASPWTLSLLVQRSPGYLRPDIVRGFDSGYTLPERLFEIREIEQDAPVPLWRQIWEHRSGRIIALLLGLSVLSAIILGHRQLTARPTLFRAVRWSFLLYTLIFIGYLAQGQLSITNVFTVLQVLTGAADSSILLIDPVIFILWCYVLLTLLIWGRGYFCGWLCPFGVLQEMTAWLGERLKLRQRRIGAALHNRLRLLKYLILAGLVGVSFYQLGIAERGAEIEPFKTAITMGFIREWPFVIYALVLLAIGLVVHKFFCRYLCPLGASLAVLGRFHLFRWLPRRSECGSPCKRCNHRCGIRAIEPDGRINYSECIQCLECEVIYRDEQQCVPLINARKGKRGSGRLSGLAMEQSPVRLDPKIIARG